ncbi:glutamate--tRNA ligase [Ancylobacter dichloromethanicus]|uniref:Glutamate--tRNA ligase n=1 Tax=Ancylobacter dichloromethanicus TaxID=518825 RepID=A0A9W6J6R6_9HYPH|nr:glutamate--tRNA ligase [Ancylobacter dichloromethanicus]MBS7553033.1 glutamate--tRNA ligase [Ancylobacter dichloromethanicus]GLK70354.1 glutamate--tRNA ligase [Ancylobacter dichloromethanicus]
MSTPPVLRFAPSPTGLLHVGNARTALYNALFAWREGGTFILRYDDTDTARSSEAFAEAIAQDVAWLGLAPDRVEHQSRRLDRYDAAVARLKALGRLYPAYETEAELEAMRQSRRRRGLPPIYDRAALKLTGEARAAWEAEGRRPHWRFKLDGRQVVWDDMVRGRQGVDTATLSDPVLVREDGSYLYTLTSVVDDIEMGVTHVVRGEDHVTNSGVQIEIIEALGGPVPRFGHHNLLVLPSGEGLSKRLGHLSLRALREEGEESLAVAALAVLTGTSLAVEPVAGLDALAAKIDFTKISRAPARFDPAELSALTAATLHHLPFEAVAGRLAALGVGGGDDFWRAVRGNLNRLADAADWWRVVDGPVDPAVVPENTVFLEQAAALLPQTPWDGEVYPRWIAALKPASGRAGRALFHPLRLALTGRESGPEMKALLPLIGREKAAARLRGENA